MDVWVFGLFYGSWLLWAIAAGAATRAYQVRTADAAARALPAPRSSFASHIPSTPQ